MKNFTIAIISFVLLWGLSGCLYHGDGHVSGYYSTGYPYSYSYSGAYYDYPLFYPFGYYSSGYNYRYNSRYYPYRYYGSGHSHHDSHKPTIHTRHDGHRTRNQHLNQNENNHRQGTNTFVRSGHRGSGSRNFNRGSRANGRRTNCFGGQC